MDCPSAAGRDICEVSSGLNLRLGLRGVGSTIHYLPAPMPKNATPSLEKHLKSGLRHGGMTCCRCSSVSGSLRDVGHNHHIASLSPSWMVPPPTLWLSTLFICRRRSKARAAVEANRCLRHRTTASAASSSTFSSSSCISAAADAAPPRASAKACCPPPLAAACCLIICYEHAAGRPPRTPRCERPPPARPPRHQRFSAGTPCFDLASIFPWSAPPQYLPISTLPSASK